MPPFVFCTERYYRRYPIAAVCCNGSSSHRQGRRCYPWLPDVDVAPPRMRLTLHERINPVGQGSRPRSRTVVPHIFSLFAHCTGSCSINPVALSSIGGAAPIPRANAVAASPVAPHQAPETFGSFWPQQEDRGHRRSVNRRDEKRTDRAEGQTPQRRQLSATPRRGRASSSPSAKACLLQRINFAVAGVDGTDGSRIDPASRREGNIFQAVSM